MSDEKLKTFTNLCHVLFCRRQHDTRVENLSCRTPDKCYYELEETLDSCWECADHKRMMTYALLIIKEWELEDADKAMSFFNDSLELCQQLNEMISDHPESGEFIRRMIG